MSKGRLIYTLGTSDRTVEEFADLLERYKIKRVVDVRRFPTSKFEHFKKDNLQKGLERAGCAYDHFGNELGGYRNGGYRRHMETDAFCKALEEVEELAARDRVAILCAERLPWRCHRRFIASKLNERGWHVIHILDKDRTWDLREQLHLLGG